VAEFEISYPFEYPARAVWDYVSWTGVEQLLVPGVFTGVTFLQREPVPGAVRETHLADGSSIVEKLQTYDAHRRLYEYVLPDPGSLPLRDYRGSVEVEEVSVRESLLKFGHDCRLIGVDPITWRAKWLQIEAAVAAFIQAALEQAGTHRR